MCAASDPRHRHLDAEVGFLTLVTGTATAWLVTMYRFPGRGLLDRLLVLPLAMPTYIIAYCYVELLDFSGPVQRAARAVRLAHGQRLLVSRGAHVSAGRHPGSVGRALPLRLPLGARELRAAVGLRASRWRARSAAPPRKPSGRWRCPWRGRRSAAGAALALMECLNDLGAVQYLGVQTLTVSVYTTWLQRSSLGGAAQIAPVSAAAGRRR